MGSYMYRHRPNLVALTGAVMTFISGILVYFMQFHSTGGHVELQVRLLILTGTMLLTATFLIIAFARYKFTHLWSTKHRGKHDRSMQKHHHH